MNRLLFHDHESLSQTAAKEILSTIRAVPQALICLATGSTPKRTYELLVEIGSRSADCFNSVRVLKLDEWGGLAENHPATCEHYLRERILQPLNIQNNNYTSFRSDAVDPAAECSRIQVLVNQLGPIDLCVLGLGVNGHVGFNEPASSLKPHAHAAQLTVQTQQHSMLGSSTLKPSYGYTLGMADILNSKKILLLVSGNHKQLQLRQLLASRIETSFPASFLWLHSNVDIYNDFDI